MSYRVVFCLLSIACLAGCDRRVDVDFNYAFEQRDFEWAERLLEEGADINARFIQSKGYTNLMMAVGDRLDKEGVQFLLDRGADPDVQNFTGRTALFIAAEKGHSAHIRTLIDAGADVNIRNRNGDTVLKVAYAEGHKIVERLIREAGGVY